MNWASASGRTAALAVAAAAPRRVVVIANSRSVGWVRTGPRPALRAGAPAGGPEGSVPRARPRVHGGVEGDRRVDEGEVRERLREVADLLPGQGDLLREQPHVVAVGEHLLERRPGVVETTGPGE